MSTRTLVTAGETRDQPDDATIEEEFHAWAAAVFWLDIPSPWAISGGIGLMALSVIVQLALVRRRGWI